MIPATEAADETVAAMLEQNSTDPAFSPAVRDYMAEAALRLRVRAAYQAPPDSVRLALYRRIERELERAYRKHGREPWSRHEFYAILLEEVDETWNAIKADGEQGHVLDEVAQVAAMCFRYFETGDRNRGPHAT